MLTPEDEIELQEIVDALSVNQGKVTQVTAIRYALRQCPRNEPSPERPERKVEIDPEYAK